MTKLTVITVILVAIVTPSLCQYAIQTGLRADVRFGEGNDRFDVTNLIRRQTKHYKPNLDPQSEEFRRRYKPPTKKKYKQKGNDLPWPKLLNSETGRSVLRKRVKDKLENHVNNLANTIINKIKDMRRNEAFAYHDDMNSEGGDVEDFNTNLRVLDDVQDFKDDEVNNDNDLRRNTNLRMLDDVQYFKDDEVNNDDDLKRHNRLQSIVNELHGTNETRRTAMDPEKEILFHYAFPVDVKIEGFLQAPEI